MSFPSSSMVGSNGIFTNYVSVALKLQFSHNRFVYLLVTITIAITIPFRITISTTICTYIFIMIQNKYVIRSFTVSCYSFQKFPNLSLVVVYVFLHFHKLSLNINWASIDSRDIVQYYCDSLALERQGAGQLLFA